MEGIFTHLLSHLDRNDCIPFPCGSKADCIDHSPPLNGWTCVCSTGYEGSNSTNGSLCTGSVKFLICVQFLILYRYQWMSLSYLPWQLYLPWFASALVILHLPLQRWIYFEQLYLHSFVTYEWSVKCADQTNSVSWMCRGPLLKHMESLYRYFAARWRTYLQLFSSLRLLSICERNWVSGFVI